MTTRTNRPIIPPWRGQRAVIGAARRDTAVPECCTVFDACDQCGRRALRPHVVSGRPYCGVCCPMCALYVTGSVSA
jgi:hypothetical protein